MTASTVSVLGLGAMGRAAAAAFLAAGHRVTVWNRTAGRAADLESAGAAVASSPAEAVTASALSVVCVLDPPAVAAVLDTVDDHLDGVALVNLTSSGPDSARALAARVTQAGARYLDGTIMVPTPLVGTDDGFVLYSGDRSVFDDHVSTLRALGPDAELLGDDAGLAALYDLAMLDIFFNGMTAFLHAAALVGADGVPASTFLPYAERIIDVLRFTVAGLASDVDDGRRAGDEDNLDMETVFLGHIVDASASRGLDTSVPEVIRTLARTAIAAGYGRDGFTRIVDVLRGEVSANKAE